MEVMKTIGKGIGNLFFLLLFLLILTCGIGFFMGYRPYVVLSGSMEPTIHTGSLAIVDTNANYQEVEVEDIIAFQMGDTLVTHRVVNKDNEGLTTKGDANEDTDAGIVTYSNFKGETKFSVPYAGYLIQWVQTTQGKIVMITLLGVIIMLRLIFYFQTSR